MFMVKNMQEEINDVKLNYILYGEEKKETVVLLHGWGQNIEMMRPIGDRLARSFNIVIVDLPGFGKSSEPTKVWTIYDYASCINELLNRLNVKKPILIGHSFGGKIALAYATKYETSKLVLLASPFRKIMNKDSFKTKLLKGLKKIPLLNKLEGYAKKHMGSVDYRNASPMMRNILVEHVNLSLEEEVKKITCPTLIIWGTNDQAVSIEDGYLLNNLIKGSGIVTYEGCTHYAYLERLGQTISVLYSFLGGN